MSTLSQDDRFKLGTITRCFLDDEWQDPAACETEAEYHGLDLAGFGSGRAVFRVRRAKEWDADFMDYRSVVKVPRKENDSPFGGITQNRNEIRMSADLDGQPLADVRASSNDDAYPWLVMKRMKRSSSEDPSVDTDGWKCLEIEEPGVTFDGELRYFDYGGCFPEDEFPEDYD